MFFEHAYLLVSRSVEVRDLKLSSVIDEGYIVERRKGSKDNIILWSKRLRDAYQEALRWNKSRRIKSIYLIPGIKGTQITNQGLKSAMSRLKKKMFEESLDHVFWTLHDLKRKGVSDADSNRIAGHRTDKMRERYNVILEKFEPPK